MRKGVVTVAVWLLLTTVVTAVETVVTVEVVGMTMKAVRVVVAMMTMQALVQGLAQFVEQHAHMLDTTLHFRSGTNGLQGKRKTTLHDMS
jgi:hypothetical protein